jgi:thiamine pyrophosphate-dependent acetolactate synthase large subunit-like protein
MRHTGSSLLLRILQLLGTKQIFAYPGGAILPLFDAIP